MPEQASNGPAQPPGRNSSNTCLRLDALPPARAEGVQQRLQGQQGIGAVTRCLLQHHAAATASHSTACTTLDWPALLALPTPQHPLISHQAPEMASARQATHRRRLGQPPPRGHLQQLLQVHVL